MPRFDAATITDPRLTRLARLKQQHNDLVERFITARDQGHAEDAQALRDRAHALYREYLDARDVH